MPIRVTFDSSVHLDVAQWIEHMTTWVTAENTLVHIEPDHNRITINTLQPSTDDITGQPIEISVRSAILETMVQLYTVPNKPEFYQTITQWRLWGDILADDDLVDVFPGILKLFPNTQRVVFYPTYDVVWPMRVIANMLAANPQIYWVYRFLHSECFDTLPATLWEALKPYVKNTKDNVRRVSLPESIAWSQTFYDRIAESQNISGEEVRSWIYYYPMLEKFMYCLESKAAKAKDSDTLEKINNIPLPGIYRRTRAQQEHLDLGRRKHTTQKRRPREEDPDESRTTRIRFACDIKS